MRIDGGQARLTALRHVTPLRAASSLVRVHGSAYQMVLTTDRRHAVPAVDDRVIYVPLNAILDASTVQQWRLRWHCEATHNPSRYRVVPRRIDGVWSQGAVVLVETASRSTVDVDNSDDAQTHAHDPDAAPGIYLLKPVSQVTTTTFVDLLQNPTLLRAFLDVPVCIQVLPPHSDLHEDRCAQIDEVGQVRSLFYRNGWWTYDAVQSDGLTLNASQLMVAARQHNLSLVPIVCGDGSTLRAFVMRNFVPPHRNRRKNAGSSRDAHWRAVQSNDAVDRRLASSPWRPLRAERSEERLVRAAEEDDSTVDRFAQRLLSTVDSLVPGDAVGVVIRPLTAEAVAFVQQQCPYMRFRAGAFVPALSRLWPKPTKSFV